MKPKSLPRVWKSLSRPSCSAGLAAGSLFITIAAGSLHADVLLGLAADSDTRGGINTPNVNSLQLQTGGSGSPVADRSSVFVFQLPDLGATANPFTSANFSFNYISKVSAVSTSNPTFNLDLYGLTARSTATVTTNDWYGVSNTPDPTDAIRLQDDIITPSTPQPQLTTTSTDGSGALVLYLNTQYDSGNGIGKFVFLRLSTDGGSVAANKGYFTTSSEGGVAGPTDTRPQIVFTTTPIAPPPTEIAKADNQNNLNLGTSWVGGNVPTPTQIAKWDATVTSSNTTVLGADLTWTGIKITDPAGTVTIDPGNSLTLGAGLVDIDMSAATSDFTLNAPLVLGAANAWNVAAGRTLTVAGGISGNQPIDKKGTGTVTLTGASSSNGGFVHEIGNLNINNPAALGTGLLTLAGGSIDNTSGAPLTLSTNNPQLWTAMVTFIGTGDLNLGTGPVTLTTTRNVSVTAGTLTVGGVISGNAGLNKLGAGTLLLSGANDFNGQVVISGGGASVLKVTSIADAGQPSSLGAGTGTPSSVIRIGDVSSPGTFEYVGTAPGSTDRKIQVGSSASGSGSATILNNNADPNNTLTFTNAAFNNVATGTPFGRSLTLGGSNAGINEIKGTIANNTLNGLGNAGTIDLNKSGAGTWKISGANTYTGATNVNVGTLILGSGSAIPDGPGAGGLKVNGNLGLSGASETVNNLNGNGVIDSKVAGSPVLTVYSDTDQVTTFAGTIMNTAGTVSLTKTGPGSLTLSGINTYSGETRVNEGTLALDLGQAIADSGRLQVTGGMVQIVADETVNTLYFDGAPQPAGMYGSGSAPGGTIMNDTRFAVAGAGILTVLTTGPVIATPYDGFVALYQPGFTQNLPGQDQDGDGLSNQQEFAFGLNPTSGASVNPIVGGVATNGDFSYTRYASSGLNYKIETSTDLVNWTVATGAMQTLGAVGAKGVQTVAVTTVGAAPVNGKLFVRVSAK